MPWALGRRPLLVPAHHPAGVSVRWGSTPCSAPRQAPTRPRSNVMTRARPRLVVFRFFLLAPRRSADGNAARQRPPVPPASHHAVRRRLRKASDLWSQGFGSGHNGPLASAPSISHGRPTRRPSPDRQGCPRLIALTDDPGVLRSPRARTEHRRATRPRSTFYPTHLSARAPGLRASSRTCSDSLLPQPRSIADLAQRSLHRCGGVTRSSGLTPMSLSTKLHAVSWGAAGIVIALSHERCCCCASARSRDPGPCPGHEPALRSARRSASPSSLSSAALLD